MRVVDLAILGAYLVAMVGIGLWAGRRNRTADHFVAAGRSIPGWAVGFSIFGTYVSSISFLALPGKSYASNWNAFVFSLSIPLAAWLAVRYFVPFYRARGEVSAYHHLEARFGPWARSYAALCYILTQLARMGAITYLLALAMAPLTGFSLVTLILLTGLVVLIYTFIGGMEAVIWTDVVQSFLLIGGALACCLLLLFGMPEGPGQIFRIAAEHGKFGFGSFGASLAESTFWVVLVYGLFMNLQNFGIDQSFVQRYATTRTDREAANSVWLGALLYLPISALFLFIGVQLFAYYLAYPELLPAAAAQKPDSVFPHFIATALPVGVTGLVIAGIFAAAQSTLASSVNCCATLFLCDWYRRYLRPGAGERESMAVLRGATIGFSCAGTLVALAMIRVQTALDAWWQLSGIFSGGMLGLFLLGLVSRRVTGRSAAVGVLAGVAVIAWMSLSPSWSGEWERFRSPLHSFLVVVVGTLTIVAVGALAGSLSAAPSRRGVSQGPEVS